MLRAYLPSGNIAAMRAALWMLCGLLLACCSAVHAATPASAASVYAVCLQAGDPADCLARESVKSSKLNPRETLDAVLRHGLVDLVPVRADVLKRGLDSVGSQLLYPGLSSAMREDGRRSLLAAIALLAASRHGAQPFANPVYLEFAHAASDDPRIPVLAMAMWVKFVGMNGWPADFRVTHAGLPVIWERALDRRQQDAALLAQIAGDLGFLDELKPQAQAFLLWYAQRPEELSTGERFRIATQLARDFSLPEQAEAVLSGVPHTPGWNMSGVRDDIAISRLAGGYDAASARQLVNSTFHLFEIGLPGIRSPDGGKRDALERAGARDELRELGAAHVREAEKNFRRPEESRWYALASDYYLRAGDRERALELARLALRKMPELVRQEMSSNLAEDRKDPAAMVKATQGHGTDAAVALYRAGAVGEALETHYLTGRDRYANAERAGQKRNPQWMLDYGWQTDIDLMTLEIARSDDRELQRRAYEGLVRSCQKPLAGCSAQTLRNIAQVAEGMGDVPRAKEALGALVRQIDVKEEYAGTLALHAAGSWAHGVEQLRRPQSLTQR